MLSFFLFINVVICFAILFCLYRAIFGPGVFNRIAALNVIGTKTILLLVVMGYFFERPEFFDIALLYAMLNFIGTLIASKYLEKGHLWSSSTES
jgi:multicomponent Na+:H+ antiporter subunit F